MHGLNESVEARRLPFLVKMEGLPAFTNLKPDNRDGTTAGVMAVLGGLGSALRAGVGRAGRGHALYAHADVAERGEVHEQLRGDLPTSTENGLQ